MSAANANTIRRLADANLTKTKALPAAAATNYTDFIDLGSTVLGPMADEIEVLVQIEGTPDLVDDKTITLTLQDSADGVSGAAIASLATLVQTGAGGAGAAANERRYKFPPATRRYVRLGATVLTGGGDNTAKSYTLKILANA